MRNNTLNITFLTPHVNISGGVKAILIYANKLSLKGHNVTVISQDKYPRIKNLLKVKPKWIDLEASLLYVPNFSERYIPKGDILVATAWQTAPFVNTSKPDKGKKFYLIQHYESLWAGNSKEIDLTYNLPLRKIVISSWLQSIMKEKFNDDSFLIVTPVDFTQFYINNGCKIQIKNIRICMLHHLYDWKGVLDGLKAFEICKRKHPEIKLVMFGVRKKELDIDCEYHFNPPQSEIKNIYGSCDIFLCPSWYEGLGMPSMEAMACKCALVTTDTGGCRDYAINEKTALVSPPQNPEILAANLIRLIEDQDLLKKISINGYNKIREFNWEDTVNKMELAFMESIQ